LVESIVLGELPSDREVLAEVYAALDSLLLHDVGKGDDLGFIEELDRLGGARCIGICITEDGNVTLVLKSAARIDKFVDYVAAVVKRAELLQRASIGVGEEPDQHEKSN